MHVFKDANGQEWAIAIDCTAIKRIRALTGFDIAELGDEALQKLSDVVLLCDVLYAAVKEQADGRGTTPEQFGEAMYADVLEHAHAALLDEVVNFTPNPVARMNQRKRLDAIRKVADIMQATAGEELDNLDAEKVAKTALGRLSTITQESAG